MVQTISDGFHYKNSLRSVLVLAGFSRAYDNVWYLQGIETADILAKEGSKLDQTTTSIDFISAKTSIKKIFRDEWNKITKVDERRKQELQYQQRDVHMTIWKRRVASTFTTTEESPICKACGDKNVSIEHMLQFCAMYTEPRFCIFVTTNISLDTLTKQPDDVIQYLKKIGRWPRPYRASQRP